MRTVASPRRLATGAISSSNESPSASSTPSGRAVSGRPVASVGKTSDVSVFFVISGSLCDWLRTRLRERRLVAFCAGQGRRAVSNHVREELGVVLDPAEERGAASVL